MMRGKPRDGSKNPGGRPVIWTEEAKAEAGRKLLTWFLPDHTRLFFKRFAHEEYDLSWQALYASCKDNETFLVAHARAKEIQEERLAEGGLNGELNATMAYNALKNVAGWRDKQEIEHSGEVTSRIIEVQLPAKK